MTHILGGWGHVTWVIMTYFVQKSICDPILIRGILFDWKKFFPNTSVNEKVAIFNRPILNILNNYIPHETIVCKDRDPPWFNGKRKLLIKEKTTGYKYFRENGNVAYWQHCLKVLQDRLNNSIDSSK